MARTTMPSRSIILVSPVRKTHVTLYRIAASAELTKAAVSVRGWHHCPSSRSLGSRAAVYIEVTSATEIRPLGFNTMTKDSWLAMTGLCILLATSAGQAHPITLDAGSRAPGAEVSDAFDGLTLAHVTFTEAGLQS